MKKAKILPFLVIVSLSFHSVVNAAIVDANEIWKLTLDSGQSINCIAQYIPQLAGVPDSLVFSQLPEITSHFTGGDWTDWQMVLSADQKMVYMYGPLNTNDTSFDDVGWFSWKLFFQWDDTDPDYDPTYPVHIDTALFNGDFGTPSFEETFWKGNPGGWPDAWSGPEPSVGGPYTNPAPIPEPMTVCILALGVLFLRIKPRT